MRIRNSRYNRLFAGLGGTAFGLDYRVEFNYRNVDNLALYLLNRSRPLPKFDVVYDTARILSFVGTITLPLVPGLDLSGTLIQNFFTLDREEKPWHLPSFSFNTTAIYTLADPGIQLRADLFLENGLPYQLADGSAANLNALFDLSLGAEYKLTDKFGAWVQLNNLANNKRQTFVQYPTIGFNALGGISLRF
ncbi:MAG: hypothetical protein HC821_00145 [Lewinella sp.]|nr:hypothetical protein [Lewinella sp.]